MYENHNDLFHQLKQNSQADNNSPPWTNTLFLHNYNVLTRQITSRVATIEYITQMTLRLVMNMKYNTDWLMFPNSLRLMMVWWSQHRHNNLFRISKQAYGAYLTNRPVLCNLIENQSQKCFGEFWLNLYYFWGQQIDRALYKCDWWILIFHVMFISSGWILLTNCFVFTNMKNTM
jgi:hypothetical protein